MNQLELVLVALAYSGTISVEQAERAYEKLYGQRVPETFPEMLANFRAALDQTS